jgi:hypothetical protein
VAAQTRKPGPFLFFPQLCWASVSLQGEQALDFEDKIKLQVLQVPATVTCCAQHLNPQGHSGGGGHYTHSTASRMDQRGCEPSLKSPSCQGDVGIGRGFELRATCLLTPLGGSTLWGLKLSPG